MIISKPWGHENLWAHTEKYVGKVIFIKDGHKLSKQYHKTKDESIMILSGEMTLLINNTELQMKPGDAYHIKPNDIHRFIANNGDVTLVEVSTPELSDVVRLEDDYNRATDS